jgi:hypothetical protein
VGELYTFPNLTSTLRNPSVVTVGREIELTTSFSAALPSGMTADVSIVPFFQYAAVTPTARVSGASVIYSFVVLYDVVHTGTITLRYGSVQEVYTLAFGTLTEEHIWYTFPSSFTFSGASNKYEAGVHLKPGLSGSLTLTFTGGDRLHSSVVATQIEYVKVAQGGTETTIDAALLTCSDSLETLAITSITPTSTTSDLTLKVKLRSPIGALSSELTAIVPIGAYNSPFWPAGVIFTTPTSTGCNLTWDYTSTPIPLGVADYWLKYIDLSMYMWNDNTPVTPSSILTKFGLYGPKFTPAYYATTEMPVFAQTVMTPARQNMGYYFAPHLDFKWGYSVPTYANRIALCLDTLDFRGRAPHFEYHAENKTTWRLWGYPNKNYDAAESTLLGTFTTANFTRFPAGTFKWNQLSWPSGARFTHYLWQPSTYNPTPPVDRYYDHTFNSCPPILGM